MQKLQSYCVVAILLLFSQINCTIPTRQIACNGIGFIGSVGVGIVGETIFAKFRDQLEGKDNKFEFCKIKPVVSLFSIACALPALGAYHLLEGNRFGKKLQYLVSIATPAVFGIAANYLSLRNSKRLKKDPVGIMLLGFVRGLIYSGSALGIKALADFGANQLFPSKT